MGLCAFGDVLILYLYVVFLFLALVYIYILCFIYRGDIRKLEPQVPAGEDSFAGSCPHAAWVRLVPATEACARESGAAYVGTAAPSDPRWPRPESLTFLIKGEKPTPCNAF